MVRNTIHLVRTTLGEGAVEVVELRGLRGLA